MGVTITTKYDVGYTFWVARSRKEYVDHTVTINDILWSREELKYRPAVKQKRIIGVNIEIRKNEDPRVHYLVIDNDCDGSQYNLPGHYTENQITDFGKEEAMNEAKYYADQEKEYYGG